MAQLSWRMCHQREQNFQVVRVASRTQVRNLLLHSAGHTLSIPEEERFNSKHSLEAKDIWIEKA